MILSLPVSIILIGTAFVTAVLSGMMGLAGGFLLMAVIASLIHPPYVVPLLSSVLLISNGARVALFYQHIRWRVVGYYVIGLCPGAFVGIFIYQKIPGDLIKLLMGVFIFLVTYLPRSERESRIGVSMFFPVGFIAGLLGVFFGATGPLTAPFYIRNDILKDELIATKATGQVVTHMVNLSLFGFIGIHIWSHWKLLACLSAAVVLGTYAGKKLLGKLSFETFILWFKVLLTLISLRIIGTQIFKLVVA